MHAKTTGRGDKRTRGGEEDEEAGGGQGLRRLLERGPEPRGQVRDRLWWWVMVVGDGEGP